MAVGSRRTKLPAFQLVDDSAQGTLIHVNLKIVYANAAAARIMGYPQPEDLLALSSVFDLLAPEEQQLASRKWENLKHAEEPTGCYQWRGMRKDGSRFPITLLRSTLIWEGMPTHQLTFLDTSGHGEFRSSPLPSERLLQAVIDTIPLYLFVKDEVGRLAMVNAQYCSFFDVTPEDCLGRRLEEISGRMQSHVHRAQEQDQQALASIDGVRFPDYVVENNRNEARWMSMMKLPLRDEAGRVVGLLGMVEDVTDARKTREDLIASRRLMRIVLDTIPFHIFVKDVVGRYVMVNRAYCEFYGVTPEQCLGKTTAVIPGVTPEQVREAAEQDRQAFVSGGKVEFRDAVRRNAQGESRYMTGLKLPLHDEHGEVVGLLGVLEDTTDTRRTQAQLEESQRLMRLILDTLPQEVALKDLDGRLVVVNETLARNWGATPTELVGKMGVQLQSPGRTPPEERRAILLTDAKVAAGETVEYEIERLTPRGPRMLRATKVPLRLPSGEVSGILVLAEDVTERRRAEERRTELEAQLEQSQKIELIGQLAAGVAHDFNNLLTPIVGHAELLLTEARSDEPTDSSLRIILQAGQRASELTRQLLTFGRKLPLETRVLDLNAEISSMLPMARRILGAGIDIHARMASPLGGVRADATQVHQVLMNLVVNAQGAMPMGGTLTIGTANTFLTADHPALASEGKPGAYVQLSVTDTGIGMSTEILARIFEPFFTTKEPGKGTGLGLSIVHSVVQRHGGLSQVESSPNEGSTFRIFLPLVEADAPDSLGAVDRRPAPRGAETVLIVDPDDMARGLMECVLKDLGYTIHTAADYPMAVALAAQIGPQLRLVITDLVLAKHNGMHLYSQLALNYPELKVLYVSGHPQFFELQASSQYKDLPLIGKPFRILRFAAQVREALDGTVGEG